MNVKAKVKLKLALPYKIVLLHRSHEYIVGYLKQNNLVFGFGVHVHEFVETGVDEVQTVAQQHVNGRPQIF